MGEAVVDVEVRSLLEWLLDRRLVSPLWRRPLGVAAASAASRAAARHGGGGRSAVAAAAAEAEAAAAAAAKAEGSSSEAAGGWSRLLIGAGASSSGGGSTAVVDARGVADAVREAVQVTRSTVVDADSGGEPSAESSSRGLLAEVTRIVGLPLAADVVGGVSTVEGVPGVHVGAETLDYFHVVRVMEALLELFPEVDGATAAVVRRGAFTSPRMRAWATARAAYERGGVHLGEAASTLMTLVLADIPALQSVAEAALRQCSELDRKQVEWTASAATARRAFSEGCTRAGLLPYLFAQTRGDADVGAEEGGEAPVVPDDADVEAALAAQSRVELPQALADVAVRLASDAVGAALDYHRRFVHATLRGGGDDKGATDDGGGGGQADDGAGALLERMTALLKFRDALEAAGDVYPLPTAVATTINDVGAGHIGNDDGDVVGDPQQSLVEKKATLDGVDWSALDAAFQDDTPSTASATTTALPSVPAGDGIDWGGVDIDAPPEASPSSWGIELESGGQAAGAVTTTVHQPAAEEKEGSGASSLSGGGVPDLQDPSVRAAILSCLHELHAFVLQRAFDMPSLVTSAALASSSSTSLTSSAAWLASSSSSTSPLSGASQQQHRDALDVSGSAGLAALAASSASSIGLGAGTGGGTDVLATLVADKLPLVGGSVDVAAMETVLRDTIDALEGSRMLALLSQGPTALARQAANLRRPLETARRLDAQRTGARARQAKLRAQAAAAVSGAERLKVRAARLKAGIETSLALQLAPRTFRVTGTRLK